MAAISLQMGKDTKIRFAAFEPKDTCVLMDFDSRISVFGKDEIYSKDAVAFHGNADDIEAFAHKLLAAIGRPAEVKRVFVADLQETKVPDMRQLEGLPVIER